MSFIYMKKEDFDFLVERSLELAEFHHSDIEEAAALVMTIPEWATHFAGDLIGGCEFMVSEEIK